MLWASSVFFFFLFFHLSVKEFGLLSRPFPTLKSNSILKNGKYDRILAIIIIVVITPSGKLKVSLRYQTTCYSPLANAQPKGARQLRAHDRRAPLRGTLLGQPARGEAPWQTESTGQLPLSPLTSY